MARPKRISKPKIVAKPKRPMPSRNGLEGRIIFFEQIKTTDIPKAVTDRGLFFFEGSRWIHSSETKLFSYPQLLENGRYITSTGHVIYPVDLNVYSMRTISQFDSFGGLCVDKEKGIALLNFAGFTYLQVDPDRLIRVKRPIGGFY